MVQKKMSRVGEYQGTGKVSAELRKYSIPKSGKVKERMNGPVLGSQENGNEVGCGGMCLYYPALGWLRQERTTLGYTAS